MDSARFDELARVGSPALFTEFIEPLCDAFTPQACDRYAELFLHAIARALPEAGPRRAATASAFRGPDPANVCVLSRVTLGADAAITSVVLDGARRRFPGARLHFAGPRKNFELFGANPDLEHIEVNYGRGAALAGRLRAALDLRRRLETVSGIVIDPDSRLTQLGLIPVVDDGRYFFWESRSCEPESTATLGQLAALWMQRTFDVTGARPWVAPMAEPVAAGRVCISLGVGGNDAKRVDDRFEAALVAAILDAGERILIDHGAGGEESDRVRRAIAAHPAGRIAQWQGAFAPFAASIVRAKLYTGYDSAGQHVAAAAGVPSVIAFHGYPNERFLRRWTPWGPGAAPVVISHPPFQEQAVEAVRRLLA